MITPVVNVVRMLRAEVSAVNAVGIPSTMLNILMLGRENV
jgi:hypothetical protein